MFAKRSLHLGGSRLRAMIVLAIREVVEPMAFVYNCLEAFEFMRMLTPCPDL